MNMPCRESLSVEIIWDKEKGKRRENRRYRLGGRERREREKEWREVEACLFRRTAGKKREFEPMYRLGHWDGQGTVWVHPAR